MDGGPADKRSPVEGDPQEDLRPIGEALHERVDHDRDQRGGTDEDREAVELEKDRKADHALGSEIDERRNEAYLAGGDRAGAGTFNFAVEVAVDDVVEGAACAAHDDGADEEEQRVPEIGQTAAPRLDLCQRE